MDSFLNVDRGSRLPGSPTNSFLADEVASICPLITPSPPTNDLINPPPENTEPNYTIGEQLVDKLQQVHEDDKDGRDSASASSSSSALAEPSCTQLLNHRNNAYHHIIKDEEAVSQETSGKVQPLQLTFRNPPEDYFFMTWNWPLIRKVSLWVFLSGLAAMVALVVGMIWTLPKTCNPPTQWYQGNLFYEIFPASFYSSGKHMEGDLQGIAQKSDYLSQLGVRVVRLNSIFNSPQYPEDFENITSLKDIAPSLGTINDFKNLARSLHTRNISIVLDLPVYPIVKTLVHKKLYTKNDTNTLGSLEFMRISEELDIVEDALKFWTFNGADGFYLKGIEHLTDDNNFAASLRRWKKFLGQDRIIIVSEQLIKVTPPSLLNIILNNVDLVDIKLEIENGVAAISKQIDAVQNGTFFSRGGMPWIHWSLGNVRSKRLANVLPFGNATLGATLLQMMLPGTPSIFYGDEVGLQQIPDPKGEREDIKHLHQLTMMPWKKDISKNSWISGMHSTGIFEQADIIKKMAELRMESPSIYMNHFYRDGVSKVNAEMKYSQKDFLVIQRWYPRRKSYVVACNLGQTKSSTDLSTLLYTGEVVVGPRIDSKPGTISFKEVTLWPGESVVIVLH